MKKTISTLMLGLLVTTAAQGGSGSVWSNYVSVASVQVDGAVTGDPLTFLYFTTVPTGKPACAGAPGAGKLSGSAESVKAMASAATSAFIAGKTVRVLWDTTCTVTFGNIVAIQIQ